MITSVLYIHLKTKKLRKIHILHKKRKEGMDLSQNCGPDRHWLVADWNVNFKRCSWKVTTLHITQIFNRLYYQVSVWKIISKVIFHSLIYFPMKNFLGSSIELLKIIGKGKAIPLQTWTDLEGFRKLRLPDFKTIGT